MWVRLSIQNLDDMTPLHLACDSMCELFTVGDEDCKRDLPTYNVVSKLIRNIHQQQPGVHSILLILSDKPNDLCEVITGCNPHAEPN